MSEVTFESAKVNPSHHEYSMPVGSLEWSELWNGEDILEKEYGEKE
jgi:hypothetical protein